MYTNARKTHMAKPLGTLTFARRRLVDLARCLSCPDPVPCGPDVVQVQ